MTWNPIGSEGLTEPAIYMCDLETYYADEDEDELDLPAPPAELLPPPSDGSADEVPETEPIVIAGESPTYYLPDQMTGRGAVRLAEVLRRFPLGHYETIVLSFERVSALDATGLAITVRLYSQLVTTGRKLVFRDVPKGIREQLSTVGLDSLFKEQPKSGRFLRPITDKLLALGRKKGLKPTN